MQEKLKTPLLSDSHIRYDMENAFQFDMENALKCKNYAKSYSQRKSYWGNKQHTEKKE